MPAGRMPPAAATAPMAEVDRLMVEEYGILLIQMMENIGKTQGGLSRKLEWLPTMSQCVLAGSDLSPSIPHHERQIYCPNGRPWGLAV